MMIIGVDNTFHLGNETITLLKSAADKNQIAYIHLKVLASREYKGMLLKKSVDIIKKNQEIKLCIIEFTKKALTSLKAIKFDCIVFFDGQMGYKKYCNHHMYFVKNKLKKLCDIRTLIVPDTMRCRLDKDISYGWSKGAHISLTSSEEEIEGVLEVQCILQHPTIALKGDFTTPREFGINGKARYPEQILAAVAILILYGFDFYKTKYKLE